ncbi:MAG: hypothetical protein RLZZ22_1289 [Pseudomonadota bacterium]|jgi:hypothetical protein
MSPAARTPRTRTGQPADMSHAFRLDAARRLVHRADVRRLPVNPAELKQARAILRAAAAADLDTSRATARAWEMAE